MKSNNDKREYVFEAPAKINLILRIQSRRDDGYHELETWMQKLVLCDRILLRLNTTADITCECPGFDELLSGEKNLAWRAARLFFSKSRKRATAGVHITIEKSIPIAAGLGGGSSDAGTVLKALNQCFAQEFSEAELIGMAKELGADVPFFATDMESVIARGIGEKMVRVQPLKDYAVMLVNPGFSVSTAAVFENFALTRTDKNSTLTGFRKLYPGELHTSDVVNDLENVAISQYPVIAQIKEELKKAGAERVLMSGSGPTVFGLFPKQHGRRQKDMNAICHDLTIQYGEQVYLTEPRTGV